MQTDFNRGEIERFRGPILAEVGVRTKNWVIPRLGHGVPGGNEIVEVHKWLDEAAKTRGALAKKYPASRIPRDKAPTRAEWAAALLDEGKSRLEKPDTLYSGLMQIKGAQQRWPDVPAATEALKILTEYDSRAQRPWDEDDIAEQRRFLVAQARGIDAYATGELPQQYAQQRLDMLKAALNLWQVVLQDGQDKKAAAEAAKHIPLLLNRIAEEEKQ